MTKCLNCKSNTDNPKFCSRSCSATYTNSKKPKRSRSNKCKQCMSPILSSRTYCKKCFECTRPDWSKTTLRDISGKRRYQKHSRIRGLARTRYKSSGRPMICFNCGYDKHVDVCHIKAIKDHKLTEKVSKINDLKNLIALCKNCHWEFDNEILRLPRI